MTVSTTHDTRLAEIETMFRSLSPDTAQIRIEPASGGGLGTHVSIRPLRSPEAASIDIRIDKETGFAYLSAGRDFAVDDIYWEGELPLARICQAIASGGLTEETRLWLGKEVATRGWLRVRGEADPLYSNRIYSLRRRLAALILGGEETRTTHYPPYGEIESA